MPDTQKQTEKSQKKLSLAIIINGKTETTNDSYEIERKARKKCDLYGCLYKEIWKLC